MTIISSKGDGLTRGAGFLLLLVTVTLGAIQDLATTSRWGNPFNGAVTSAITSGETTSSTDEQHVRHNHPNNVRSPRQKNKTLLPQITAVKGKGVFHEEPSSRRTAGNEHGESTGRKQSRISPVVDAGSGTTSSAVDIVLDTGSSAVDASSDTTSSTGTQPRL